MKVDVNDKDPLGPLAEEFTARYRAGEQPSLSEYLERCPEQAEHIRALFPIMTLLEQASESVGDAKDPPPQLSDLLLQQLYTEMRQMAAWLLSREREPGTLNPTALVHEAYLRVVGNDPQREWDGRGHFFAAAAEAMRRVLVERARRRKRLRHGGGRQRLELDESCVAVDPPSDDLMALDEALTKLAAQAPMKAELVKLRYFVGLTVAEAAAALGISEATAARYWQFARVWLYAEMRDGEVDQTPTPRPDYE